MGLAVHHCNWLALTKIHANYLYLYLGHVKMRKTKLRHKIEKKKNSSVNMSKEMLNSYVLLLPKVAEVLKLLFVVKKKS